MEECKPLPPARQCFHPGDRAPDFRAPAYFRGKEIEVGLSDFRGRWLLLFFYSSDFTFV
jgi:alkyl hydroperoxide reductase subunit AhpC